MPGGRALAFRSGATVVLAVLGIALPALAVSIETVTVYSPANAGEWSGESYGGHGPDRVCGAVDYVYSIGKFEVTAAQYCEFLNAVGATDPYGLYNTHMADPTAFGGCNIQRSGTTGSYSYSVASEWADRPVNYIVWGDAARFCNWLHNGQPVKTLTGDPNEDGDVTEDGSYAVNGATSDPALLGVTRKEDATWVIPSEDEWYKAAYHKNDGVTGNYFDYPTSSDSRPSNDLVDPDPGNNATFYDGGFTIGSPYYRTEVGAHENSESPYGTFDQGGNVFEWNEAIVDGLYRGLRGGSCGDNDYGLHAADRFKYFPPGHSHDLFGFRVARVFEQSELLDAVGREFTVAAGPPDSTEIIDAVAREFTVAAGEPDPTEIVDAVARVFTVHNEPLTEITDAVARVFTVHNEPLTEVTDAVGRQFTVYNNMLQIVDIPDDVADGNTLYTGPEPNLLYGSPPVDWSLVEGPDGMEIEPTTGVVSWSNPSPAGSRNTVTIHGENLEGDDDESWVVTVRGPHPADANSDWAIGMNEAVGYGAAWQRGNPWPTEPNVIPLDYVTRGGYLWKVGELYEFNAAQDAPVCWQGAPLEAEGELVESAASESDGGGLVATRRISLDLGGGDPIHVTIDVVPPADAKVWAVEERPAPGCLPGRIEENGTWSPSAGVIRWGPFYDNTPQLLTYSASVTAEASAAETSFAGRVSVDGVSSTISGDTTPVPADPITFRCGPVTGMSGLAVYLAFAFVGVVILRRRLRRGTE